MAVAATHVHHEQIVLAETAVSASSRAHARTPHTEPKFHDPARHPWRRVVSGVGSTGSLAEAKNDCYCSSSMTACTF